MKQRQIAVASVVILLAVTPTWFDATEYWNKEGTDEEVRHRRTVILLWYLVVVLVALSAWRVLA